VPRSGRKETELGSLILKRANNSRLSGRWSDADYDGLENGVVVGRIFKVPVPPQDRTWMWVSGHNRRHQARCLRLRVSGDAGALIQHRRLGTKAAPPLIRGAPRPGVSSRPVIMPYQSELGRADRLIGPVSDGDQRVIRHYRDRARMARSLNRMGSRSPC
jgi:hypothetical protein